MLTISASRAVLNTKEMMPCTVAVRRIRLLGDADVGDLRGHADDEGEVDEVPVIGVVAFVAAWKLQAARLAAAIIIVRVMQRESRVHQRPRQRNGDHRKRQAGTALIGGAELEHNRRDAGERAELRHDHHEDSAVILQDGARLDVLVAAASHHDVGEHEIDGREHVPADQRARHQPPRVRHQEEYEKRHAHRDEGARPGHHDAQEHRQLAKPGKALLEVLVGGHRSDPLFLAHDLCRKTGAHFSGSCASSCARRRSAR